jgi:hypothetical protein
MLIRWVATVAALAFVPQTARAQEKYLHTDSIGSEVVETSHTFHCEANRLQISFVERLRRDEQLDLVDRWRIVLTGLAVSGRTIAAADLRRLESKFHDHAWIERVTARCTRFNREVYVTVVGMRAEDWAAFGEERVKQRPRPISFTFTVREDGTIRFQ